MIAALVLAAAVATPPLSDFQAQGLHLSFERIGHYGRVYLNADGGYLIVQTDPAGRTTSFTGKWTARPSGGVCIAPDDGGPGKCLLRLPARLNRIEEVRSSLDEVYRIGVYRGR